MEDLVMETERLIIRPFRKEDYKNWLTQLENQLPSQYKYDDGKGDMSACTPEWFNDMVMDHQQGILLDKDYIFGVFLKEGNLNIGTLDLSTLMRHAFQWARIGYTIYNQFWNHGYGSEAVQGLIQIGFEQLQFHRIEAHISTDNQPSIKLAERIGMEFECVKKDFVYEFGKWNDNLVYYVLAEE